MSLPSLPPRATTLRLPDELLLLALRESGGMKRQMEMSYALGGAALLELVLGERLDIDGKRVQVLSREPIGHPACDDLLARIAGDEKPRTIGYWIRKTRGKLREGTAAELVRAELVRREDVGFGPFTWQRYPALPNGEEAALERRLTAVMVDGATPDDRSAILVLLLDAAGLLTSVVKGTGLLERRRRIKELGEQTYASASVAKAVKAVKREIDAVRGGAAAGAGA